MNGKGRKLFRSAVGILTSVMMMGAYTTTAMASGIGVIDAKDMLDIHAEANTASAVIGQVMEDYLIVLPQCKTQEFRQLYILLEQWIRHSLHVLYLVPKYMILW